MDANVASLTESNYTVMRLPLRNMLQASRQKIKSHHSSMNDIKNIFDICENKWSTMLLFLRNIKVIQVLELNQNG